MSKTKVLLLALVLAIAPLYLFAQSSGKVVGVVKDKTSGEALPGVNISIEGSQYGAATDVDGYFVILNVPVGVYDIRANFVGYGDVVQQGVRITADKTTEVNYSLEEAAIEGQAVVITAEKPLVEKYTTQSVSLVTSEDLENIPVRGFNQVIATQNSVVVQDGNIHIRGGRDDEVGFYIDGASSVNPLTNTQSLYIIQEAVEEFQVLAGGYTAEFGGANAGIVRTELKTGGKNMKFSVDFQTDKFADEGKTFLGTHSYRHHTGVATISGPLFNDKISFFIAGENAFQGDRAVRFSEGFDLVDLTGGPLVDINPGNSVKDTISAYVYPDGFTPKQEEDLGQFSECFV
ncbi:MAG: TonB-dependent receptor [Calditrichia bacterium]